MRTLLAIFAIAAAFSAVSAAPGSAPAPRSDAEDERTVVAKLEPEVTITVRSSPGAFVRWGGRALGSTPLVLKRPRGSGPLDLTLTAGGCLPLHIRAYTFTDDTLSVRLVRESEKERVFGYPAALDAGVPESPPEAPPSMP